MTIQAKIIAALSALSVLLALSAAVFYYRSEYKAQSALNSALEAQSASLTAALQSTKQLYESRVEAEKEVQQIRVDFETMKGDIRSQGRKIDEAIKQVKDNDQAVREYLAQPVPDALGRLFIREATTDPRLYGIGVEGGTVRTDTMPTPGVQSTAKQ